LFVYFILKTQYFQWQIAFIFQTGELRTMEDQGEGCKKGLGKSRGRGEKDHRDPGGGLFRDQNPGDGLQLKPFFRGILQ
jgi:hypothetical protein